jgi:hypothetical protein
MIEANLVAQTQYLDTSRRRDPGHLRGQFVPWASLLVVEGSGDGLAFKLTRGVLLVLNAGRAHLYDIEKAQLQETIEVHTLGRVDFSEQHVFIINSLLLDVYDRATFSHVLSIPAGRQPWDFYASPENQWRRTEETWNHSELGFRRATAPNRAHREDYFEAGMWSSIPGTLVTPIFLTLPCTVRVSPCGKHLAIVAMSNRVILVQDFWRLLTPSRVTLKHISKQIDFYIDKPLVPSDMETCLAYDHGKVAIFGVHGVFVLILDSLLDQLGEIELIPKDDSLWALQPRSSEHKPSWPNLRLRGVGFDDLQLLWSDIISCLQFTETKLYLSVISEDPHNERGENMWCYDFESSA